MQLWIYELLVIATIAIAVMHKTATFSIERFFALLTKLSRFIKVSIGGQIENPGEVRIPIEGSLSDVMNLKGPRKPLSGKIYLIRYNQIYLGFNFSKITLLELKIPYII